MLENYVNKLKAGVQSDMDSYVHKHNLLKYFSQRALLYSRAIASLNEKLITYNFSSREEEIQFFKIIKPTLLAEQHYSFKRAMILQECQHISKKSRDIYIGNKIARIDSFFKDHNEFLRYQDHDCTHNDELYFVRLSTRKNINLDYNLVDKDPRTTCEKGHTIGKVASKKRLLSYLQSLLRQDPLHDISHGLQVVGKLEWKGTRTEVVELIYALKSVGLLEDSISRIAEVLGSAFGYPTLDTYKTWQKIKERKIEPTKLMSKLQRSLEEQIRAEIQT